MLIPSAGVQPDLQCKLRLLGWQQHPELLQPSAHILLMSVSFAGLEKRIRPNQTSFCLCETYITLWHANSTVVAPPSHGINTLTAERPSLFSEAGFSRRFCTLWCCQTSLRTQREDFPFLLNTPAPLPATLAVPCVRVLSAAKGPLPLAGLCKKHVVPHTREGSP